MSLDGFFDFANSLLRCAEIQHTAPGRCLGDVQHTASPGPVAPLSAHCKPPRPCPIGAYIFSATQSECRVRQRHLSLGCCGNIPLGFPLGSKQRSSQRVPLVIENS
ncbi:hypothetical protein J6590_071971 [Homalodisca vitripennis]|nr:hypothetical protein J6590_071971 [Homalodisca vitripennis]